MAELCDLDAVELRRLIGTRQVSPVELLDSCIRRVETVSPTVNALVATCFPRARNESKAAEQAVLRGHDLGSLHGLPVGIKDLLETGGLRTTYGSLLYADYVPEKDERIVADIRKAGGIIVGKTNTPEFGAGANTTNKVYGPTGNPFDPRLTCAGSSGGSAVALATGMVPLATGSDFGGSLRTPASFCGIVGFRPSPGLVPSERRVVGLTPLSVQGPMGRTVADTCLLLSAIVSPDTRDPFAGPVDPAAFRQPGPVDLSGLRAAISEDLGFAPIDHRIRETFRDRVALFASVFRSCDRRDPDMGRASEALETLRAVNFVAAYKKYFDEAPDKLGPNVYGNVERGLRYSIEDIAWAHVEQTRIYREFQEFFREVDLVICPAASVPPFPHNQLYPTHINGQELTTYLHWLAITYGITLTSHPAAVIPCGSGPTGMPFGIQIVGPRRADKFVLDVAHTLERHFANTKQLARPVPKLKRLNRPQQV